MTTESDHIAHESQSGGFSLVTSDQFTSRQILQVKCHRSPDVPLAPPQQGVGQFIDALFRTSVSRRSVYINEYGTDRLPDC
jgi:hypothetical protein